MSAWPGKYVIGLTGNIATGKSVVRKMLEHLGAYGIDADALAHRAIAPDAPGYRQVIDTFGQWLVGREGQIDRARLARVVFSDPDALARLEAIIHPLVYQAVDILVRRSRQKVIVLEAIKLLESGLSERCDSLWVTYAPPNVQLERLVQKRGMSREVASQRISAQPSQEDKVELADTVINTHGSFEDTWRQVTAAWEKNFPVPRRAEPEPKKASAGEMSVTRAGPGQVKEIAALITRLSGGQQRMSREDVMEAFGEKAYLILQIDSRDSGLVGWKVENLVARTDDVYLHPALPYLQALSALMTEVESLSRELQCEVSLLFLPLLLARQDGLIQGLGYQVRSVQSLGVRAWQEAAEESMPPGTVMLFKQLRQDRVLRPV
jgi:dephospho-CoA kinase